MIKVLEAGKYYGLQKKTLDLKEILLTHSLYGSKAKIPLHRHENDVMFFILDGKFEESSGGSSEIFKKGDLVIHPSDCMHSNKFHDASVSIMNIELSDSWMEKLGMRKNVLKEFYRTGNNAIAPLIVKLYRELYLKDHFTLLAVESILLDIITKLGRERAVSVSQKPGWLRKIKELVYEEYDKTLSLSFISEAVNIHPVYISRGFKKFENKTLSDFIREVRISKAIEKLWDGKISIAGIAYECGFFDQSHFTRTFRKHTGLSPSQFRLIKG